MDLPILGLLDQFVLYSDVDVLFTGNVSWEGLLGPNHLRALAKFSVMHGRRQLTVLRVLVSEGLGGASTMAEQWLNRLLGGDPHEVSVLAAHAHCLRLVSSLGAGPAQMVLEGRLAVKADPIRFAQLSEGQVLTAVRQFLANASIQDKDIFKGACLEALYETQPVPPDTSLQRLIASTDPGVSPDHAVKLLSSHIEKVASLWGTAFENSLTPLEYTAARETNSAQVLQALVGGTFRSVVAPTPSSGEVPRKAKWNIPVQRLQGRFSTSGSPLWCSDLVPPAPQLHQTAITDGVQGMVPKVVVIGGFAQSPDSLDHLRVCASTAQVSTSHLRALISKAVVRLMPSGSTTVQLLTDTEATPITLPACDSRFVCAPSMVANVVTFAPGAVTPQGSVLRYHFDRGVVSAPPVCSESLPWEWIAGASKNFRVDQLYGPEAMAAYNDIQMSDWSAAQPATVLGDPRDYGVFSVEGGSLSLASNLAAFNSLTKTLVQSAVNKTNRSSRAVIDVYATTGYNSQKVSVSEGAIHIEVKEKTVTKNVATQTEAVPAKLQVRAPPVSAPSKELGVTSGSGSSSSKPRTVFGGQRTEEAKGNKVPRAPAAGGDSTHDWVCPNKRCVNHTRLVFGTKSVCPMCGTAKPQAKGAPRGKRVLEPNVPPGSRAPPEPAVPPKRLKGSGKSADNSHEEMVEVEEEVEPTPTPLPKRKRPSNFSDDPQPNVPKAASKASVRRPPNFSDERPKASVRRPSNFSDEMPPDAAVTTSTPSGTEPAESVSPVTAEPNVVAAEEHKSDREAYMCELAAVQVRSFSRFGSFPGSSQADAVITPVDQGSPDGVCDSFDDLADGIWKPLVPPVHGSEDVDSTHHFNWRHLERHSLGISSHEVHSFTGCGVGHGGLPDNPTQYAPRVEVESTIFPVVTPGPTVQAPRDHPASEHQVSSTVGTKQASSWDDPLLAHPQVDSSPKAVSVHDLPNEVPEVTVAHATQYEQCRLPHGNAATHPSVVAQSAHQSKDDESVVQSSEVRRMSPIVTSPTIHFEVDDTLPTPFTFDECVDLFTLVPFSAQAEVHVLHTSSNGVLVPSYIWLSNPDEFRVRTIHPTCSILGQGPFPMHRCAICAAHDCEACDKPCRPHLPPALLLEYDAQLPGLESMRVSSHFGLAEACSFRFSLQKVLSAPVVWEGLVDDSPVICIFDVYWLGFFNPQVGQRFTVLQARGIGTPVFRIEPEGQSHLVRNPTTVNGPLRHLELFAGIGGWGEGLDLLGLTRESTYIEINPEKVQGLIDRVKLPVFTPHQLDHFPCPLSCVILGSVLDRRWWKLSLASPFELWTFSSPCVSFSRGGWEEGFDSPDGQLLLHTIALVSLFQPILAVGENVQPLAELKLWSPVQELAATLGLLIQKQVLHLHHVVPMKRSRCFVVIGAVADFSPIKGKVSYPREFWTVPESFKCPLLSFGILQKLSDPSLLPASWKGSSDTLAARVVHDLPLPVLMASYTRQTFLPPALLQAKGLFTWLVQSGPLVRHFHQLEASRILGFGPQNIIDQDPAIAIAALGDSVSPLQVIQVMYPLLKQLGFHFDLDETPGPLILALACCGWPALKSLAIAVIGTHLRYVSHPVGVTGDEVVYRIGPYSLALEMPPYGLAPTALKEFVQFHLGYEVPVIAVHDDRTHGIVEVDIMSISVGTLAIPFHPLTPWGTVLKVLGLPPSEVISSCTRADTPLWMVPAKRVKAITPVLAPGHTVVTHWGRYPIHVEQTTGEALLRLCFPGFEPAALSTHDGQASRFCPLNERPPVGTFLTAQCQPVPLHIVDYGFVDFDPLAPAQLLSDFLSAKLYRGRTHVHLQVQGRLVPPTTLVGHLRGDLIRMRIFPLRGGGGKSLAVIEQELKELLQQHGVPVTELKNRVDEVVLSLGHEICQQALSAKLPWSALKEHATKKGLRLVLTTEREVHSASASSSKGPDPLQQDDPWAKGTSTTKTKKGRRSQIVLSQVEVDSSFFTVNGSPLPLITLDALSRGTSGFAVTNADEIQDRLQSFITKSKACGPAVLVVLGTNGRELGLSEDQPRCQDTNVPGWANGHPSAFRAVVIQAGDQKVQLPAVHISDDACLQPHTSVVMCHVYKSEAEHWDSLAEGFSLFLRKLGFGHTQHLLQSWSQSFYRGTRKVSHAQATYWHGFVRLPESNHRSLLQLSGVGGLYCTPRGQGRGHDSRYRVVPLPGLSLSEARAAQDKVHDAVGLVRTSRGLAVRVDTAGYLAARQVLLPDMEHSDESDPGGNRRFRILGLPAFVEKAGVKQILREISWAAKVLRSQGKQAWLLSSDQLPPSRTVTVGSHTAVILEDHPQQQGLVVASTHRGICRPGNGQPKVAAVASGSTQLPSLPLVPEVKTRYEELEAATQEHVRGLESKLDALTSTVEQAQAQSSTRIDAIATQVSGLATQVAEVSTLEDRFEKMMSSFCKQTDTRLSRTEKAHADALTEIKGLLEQSIQSLVSLGWTDAAIAANERFGTPLQPTCKDATRHSFCFLSPALQQYLLSVEVTGHGEVSTHAMLKVVLDLPTTNPQVWKWPLPKVFDHSLVHPERVAQCAASFASADWTQPIRSSLQSGDTSLALEQWAGSAEQFLSKVCSRGQEDFKRPAYHGRCKTYAPIKQKVSAPRFRAGRPTDFVVPYPSVALDVRRWQKLARRLESLVRLLRKGATVQQDLPLQNAISTLWASIRRSPLSPRFSAWSSSLLGFSLWICPGLHTLEVLYKEAKVTASRKASEHWALKREHFSQVLDENMASKGGAIAFRLLRDLPEPPVNEMKVTHTVQLSPQPWSPIGKAWIQVDNAHLFPPGTRFSDPPVLVEEQTTTHLGLSVRLTRREASSLSHTFVTADPDVWSKAFFDGWKQYWCRETHFADDHRYQAWIDALPQEPALHGAESARMPPATLHRLRSQAARAVSVHRAGMNPWVGASVGAPVIVDPEFHLLLSRLRLFRLCWKYLPQSREWLQNALHRRGRYRSVTRHLLAQLHEMHWEYDSGLRFVDQHRSFDLVSTPWKHLEWLMANDWMFHVTGCFAHRKFCTQLDTLDLDLCRTWLKFPVKDQGLLLTQLTGATYTTDIMSKVASANVQSVCPLCGAEDSRLHRTRDCPATGHLRTELAFQSSGFVFQEHHWAYGLWSEQEEVRPWQHHLDQVPWPTVPDRICDRVGFLFTDGSCAHPKVKRLRLAAAAVVEAHVDTTHRVLWSGPLPTTCQSIFRAEVLALAIAVASYGKAFVCSDNQAAVRIAARLLSYPVDQRADHLPADHTDLWSFFLQCAQHATQRSHRIKWIPAHRDWRALSGRDRVLAFFNDVADRAAKSALAALMADPGYQQLVTSWFSLTKAAFALAHFHLRVAWLFLGTDSSPDRVMPTADELRPVGPSWSLDAISVGTQRTERFGNVLSSWLAQLCWHSSSVAGLRESTPLEMLWCFIHDTGCLPPFRVGSVWGGDGAVVAHWLAVPSLPVLWQSWLDSLREVTVNGVPLLRAGRADAAASWQLGFGDFHVVGRFALSDVVFTDLVALLRRAPSLCRLRLPSFW
eukprot:Skav202419  [mRNA]  locus=scaffold1370:259470:272350:+ [translate_table: standard]